jgi:hypothetical protein
LYDRLQQQEEERKRRLRDATDIGTGAMSNLLTLLGHREVAQTIRQVKDEAGLVTLKRDYDRLQADGYTMSPNTYADTLTEYVDPGHLRKSLDTAINTGLIKDDEFGQRTVNKWGSLEVIAGHRNERNNLRPEDYWRMMSEADQGIDRGALLDEIRVLDPTIDEPQGRGLVDRILGGGIPTDILRYVPRLGLRPATEPGTPTVRYGGTESWQSLVPESTLQTIEEKANIPLPGGGEIPTGPFARRLTESVTSPSGALLTAVAPAVMIPANIAGAAVGAGVEGRVPGKLETPLELAGMAIGGGLGLGATRGVSALRAGARPEPELPPMGGGMDTSLRYPSAASEEAAALGTRLITPEMAAAKSPFEFPNPETLTADEIAGRVTSELERVAVPKPETMGQRVVGAVKTFFNPEAIKDKDYVTQQVWQNKRNRRMGQATGRWVGDWEASSRGKLFTTTPADEIATIPEGVGLSRKYGDVMSNPSLYKEWLTEEQMAFVRKRGETFEKVAQWYEDVAHERVPRRLQDEYYSPREVVEVRGRESSRMTDAFEPREYTTEAEGSAAGVKYNPASPDVAAATIRKLYNRAADVITGREYALQIGKRPIDLMDPQLLEDVRVARLAFTETRKAVRTELQQQITLARRAKADATQLVGRARRGEMVDAKAAQTAVRAAENDLRAAQRKLAQIRGKGGPVGGTTLAEQRAAVADAEQRLADAKKLVTQTKWLAAQDAVTELEAANRLLQRTERATEAAVQRHPDVLAAKEVVQKAIRIAAKAREKATRPAVGFERVSGRVGRGRIFPVDVARAIIRRTGVPETPNGIKTLSDVIFSPLRAVRATADYGVMFIQGYNPLLTHPASWSKGMSRGFRQVMFDQGSRAAYIERNAGNLKELAQLGWSPRGAEYEVGGGVLHRLPGIGRAATKFDELFSEPMNITAVEMWREGKELYKLGPADLLPGKTRGQELADSITKFTGTVRYGGGMNEQRALFAAKFVRSMVGIGGDAFKPGIKGIEARRLFRNMFVVSSIGTIAINEAMGKPWTLDLRDPRSFTVPIGNKHVSLLGPWAPVFRGVAKAVTGDPLYLGSRTTRGKLAPGLSNIVDLLTGETFMGDELDITNLKQTLGYLGEQFIPIGVGQAGESLRTIDWTDPKDVLRVIGESTLEVTGARAFPINPWERVQEARDKEAQNRGYSGWGDSNLSQPIKLEIDESPSVASLIEAADKSRPEPRTDEQRYYAQVDTLRAGQATEKERLDDQWHTAAITPKDYRDRISQLDRDVYVAMQQAQADFGITFKDKKATNPVDAAILAYYAVDADKYKDETGAVIWDDFIGAQESALAALSDADRKLAEEYIHQYWSDGQWEMFRKQQQLTDYFDIPEQVYQANKDKLGLAAPSYTAYRTQADEEARATAQAQGLGPEMVGDQHYSREYRLLGARIERERERYRRANPDKVSLMIELGYKPPSKADIARARRTEQPTAPISAGWEPLVLPLP